MSKISITHSGDHILRPLNYALSRQSLCVVGFCDGHINHGAQTPWVRIATPSFKVALQVHQYLEDYSEGSGGGHVSRLKIINYNEGESVVVTPDIQLYYDPTPWHTRLSEHARNQISNRLDQLRNVMLDWGRFLSETN